MDFLLRERQLRLDWDYFNGRRLGIIVKFIG